MRSKHIIILCTLILAMTAGIFSAIAAPAPQTENEVELLNEVTDEQSVDLRCGHVFASFWMSAYCV